MRVSSASPQQDLHIVFSILARLKNKSQLSVFLIPAYYGPIKMAARLLNLLVRDNRFRLMTLA